MFVYRILLPILFFGIFFSGQNLFASDYTLRFSKEPRILKSPNGTQVCFFLELNNFDFSQTPQLFVRFSKEEQEIETRWIAQNENRYRARVCVTPEQKIFMSEFFVRVGEIDSEKIQKRIIIPSLPFSEPKLKILGVGIDRSILSEFEDDQRSKNVIDFINFFYENKYKKFNAVTSMFLNNQEATKKNWLESLAENRKNYDLNEIYVLFYSGQGFRSEEGNYRFSVFESNGDEIAQTSLEIASLEDFFRTPSRFKILIIDSDFSGLFIKNFIRDYQDESFFSDILILASNRPQEIKKHIPETDFQNFFKALFNVLQSPEDFDRNGYLDGKEFGFQVLKQTKHLSLGKMQSRMYLPEILETIPLWKLSEE